MPPQQTLSEKVESFKQDLDRIEQMLERIKREYDLFFAGARKRQPFEMRAELDRLLRRWRSSSIQKHELQFRLTTLNSKYNAMIDIWEKILKRREIDPHSLVPFGPTTAQLAAEAARTNREREAASGAAPAGAASAGAQAAAQAQSRAAGPVDREKRMKSLFDQYLDAKRDLGESIETVNFSRFAAQLDRQAEQLREKMACRDVEFSVVKKNGKVALTAKPIK